MTTETLVTITVRCPNPFCRRFGKEMGSIDVSSETIAVTDTRYCGSCRQYHRQTLTLR
jgi:hypothetical protein